MKLEVDVISDVICPWCFIGKRRLEKAVARLGDEHSVQTHWHPFQLNPALPRDGIPRVDYRTQKFGSWERSRELDAEVTAAGLADGIHFDFERIERTPNTLDAHRLIELAHQTGCQNAVVERLFRAYFTEGVDIGNSQTLIEVASEAGLDQKAAELMLSRDQHSSETPPGGKLSKQHRVSSVPFFIINDQTTLSGAQQAPTFLDVFRQLIDASGSGASTR